MAAMKPRLFRYAATIAWPQHFGLRLLCYLAISIIAWVLPPWGALAAIFATGILGRSINWTKWLMGLGILWVFVFSPVLVALAGSLASQQRIAPPELLAALWRGLTFLVLMAAAQWLTESTTVFEIRSALQVFFRIFGHNAANTLSLVGALALGFLPWMIDQVQAVREAALLRGLPRRKPLLTIGALSLPLGIRLIEKAHHTADALELRGK